MPERAEKRSVWFGAAKAVTWLPEKQERLLLDIYKKHIYPKLSFEQQKKAKAWEEPIKQAAKAGGWLMTGGEVFVAAVIVKKGTRWLKARRVPAPHLVAEEGMTAAGQTLKSPEFAQPALDAFGDFLSNIANRADSAAPLKTIAHYKERTETLKQLLTDVFSFAPSPGAKILFQEAVREENRGAKEIYWQLALEEQLRAMFDQEKKIPPSGIPLKWRALFDFLGLANYPKFEEISLFWWVKMPKIKKA